MLFANFEPFRIAAAPGVEIAGVRRGSGPGLLLLHGHPQTRACWHKVAGPLAERFTVVAADLRGYGDSAKPPGGGDHAAYSKRAMAADCVAVMAALGFDSFHVAGHDRGARVAHRLAVDHPEAVRRLAVLDVAPTLAMYEGTIDEFARAYWHWFFLIQPEPMPERLIGADPDFYLDWYLGRRAKPGVFAPEALAEYRRCFRDPAAVRAVCEDYRAAATVDLEHDRADRDAGRKVMCPLLALWGAESVVGRCFDVLELWRRVAEDVTGAALPCGHYIPEEVPDRLVDELMAFFGGTGSGWFRGGRSEGDR